MQRTFPWRLVTVDIDGTLTLRHGWRDIAVAFGRLEAFEDTNRRFFAQEIGEDPHLADLLDLATGHTVAEVTAVVEKTPKLRGIREGVSRLHARGARVSCSPTTRTMWSTGTDARSDLTMRKEWPLRRSRTAGSVLRSPFGPISRGPSLAPVSPGGSGPHRGPRRGRSVGRRGIPSGGRRGRPQLALPGRKSSGGPSPYHRVFRRGGGRALASPLPSMNHGPRRCTEFL